MTGLSQSATSPQPTFSALAWEVARSARLEPGGAGGVKAWVVVGNATEVFGVGLTSTEAMRDLAVNLDKWARSDYAGF